MKKILFFATLLLLGFTACDQSENIIADIPSDDNGVVINGVRWATRNVDAPGTFAQNPEDAGMFFQWNRKVGWTNVDGSPLNSNGETNWNRGNQGGTEWDADNDPCPDGWRLPTQAELVKLRSANNSWATRNGVRGRVFGTVPNRIFLPAAGWLYGGNGTHNDNTTLGLYWSSSIAAANNQSRNLTFSNSLAGMRSNTRNAGYSIRCVAEQ